jgi:hypothetical protein
MPPVSHVLRLVWLTALVLLAASAVSCSKGGADAQSASATARPPATATPLARALKQQAEAQYLPRMSADLADLVRGQPFYQDLTPATLKLLSQLVKCEQAARSHGEDSSVADLFEFATEQAWYQDGLDDREATGLGGVIDAYTRSFTKKDAPPVGATIASTLQYQLFDVVTLPDTGDTAVVVASADPDLGRKAVDLVTEYLPRVTEIAGRFPFSFIYVEVTPDFPEELYGVSYDEFIGLNVKKVDAATVAHELTHSTVYGLFPTWFEEGFAYFMGYYLTDALDRGTQSAMADLRAMNADNKVDIINYGYYTERQYLAETRSGFLFVKGLYDIEGIDGLSKTVKALRSKSYNDNEMLAAIMQQAAPSVQGQVRKLFCDRIVGSTHAYCTAGG